MNGFSIPELQALGYVLQPDGFSWSKPRRTDDQKHRSMPVVQEPKADLRQPVDNTKGRKAVDEHSHPKFALTVTFFVSDNRKRDADGMLSTVLDCLVSALKTL